MPHLYWRDKKQIKLIWGFGPSMMSEQYLTLEGKKSHLEMHNAGANSELISAFKNFTYLKLLLNKVTRNGEFHKLLQYLKVLTKTKEILSFQDKFSETFLFTVKIPVFH